MSENQDNQSNKDPKLSHGMKIFILAGTVFVIGFAIVYYATHSGSSEYFRTQIEPDSNLADKELVVKQDTVKKDTAAADSANKEEEEQAKKVFNSIRGDVRHKTASTDDDTPDEDASTTTTESPADGATTTEADKPSTSTSSKSEPSPKVENVE